MVKSAGRLRQCKVLDLPQKRNPRGNLTFVEGGRQIPFSIKRIYYLDAVPGGADRGGHGHKALKQVIIALAGSFDVTLDDGRNKKKYHLNRSHRGLYVCPMVWRHIDNFSSGSVCLVLASQVYDKNDYLRDYEKFLSYAARK